MSGLVACVYSTGHSWSDVQKAVGQPTRLYVVDIPGLDAEWDAARNGKSPTQVFAGSRTEYWWHCPEDHRFKLSPKDRTQNYRRSKRSKLSERHFAQCPLCRKEQLQTVYDIPELAAEWDATKNSLRPDEVTARSGERHWWRCSVGHQFERSPHERTHHHGDSGKFSPCPDCRSADFYTWDKVIDETKKVAARHGFLPPTTWFQLNDRGALVSYVNKSGRSWDDVERAVGLPRSTPFVLSRNGKRWHSHPEASVSNFLYARGIPHEKGRKYPEEYAEFSGRPRSHYDLHFRDRDGNEVHVEVWGDNPGGRDEQGYAERRQDKERYHEGRSDFLGIHFTDAYSDETLSGIFSAFIDLPEPYIFEKSHDAQFPSSHWSNTDELIEDYVRIATEQLDGLLPNSQWLRKDGTYANRPGPSYGNMVFLIGKWIGGFKKLYAIVENADGTRKLRRMPRAR